MGYGDSVLCRIRIEFVLDGVFFSQMLTNFMVYIYFSIYRYTLITFYRATLCISAVFGVARCPSVRLSVTLVYCIQMVEDIAKLISRPCSPVILFFDPERRYPIPRGTPFSGAQNIRGWENFAIFD